MAKVFLGAAVAYMLSPIDIIPDFIPVLGHLDDLVIVPILVFLGLKLIQKREVVDDARNAMRLSRKGVQHVTASELPKAMPFKVGNSFVEDCPIPECTGVFRAQERVDNPYDLC